MSRAVIFLGPNESTDLKDLATADVVIGELPDGTGNVIKHREGHEGKLTASQVSRLRALPTGEVSEAMKELLPPPGSLAPWLIIARAGGPNGGSSLAEAKLHAVPGEPDDGELAVALAAIEATYKDMFGEEPARSGVAKLPWYAEHDDPDGEAN